MRCWTVHAGLYNICCFGTVHVMHVQTMAVHAMAAHTVAVHAVAVQAVHAVLVHTVAVHLWRCMLSLCAITGGTCYGSTCYCAGKGGTCCGSADHGSTGNGGTYCSTAVAAAYTTWVVGVPWPELCFNFGSRNDVLGHATSSTLYCMYLAHHPASTT